jgi:hypothetical protein
MQLATMLHQRPELKRTKDNMLKALEHCKTCRFGPDQTAARTRTRKGLHLAPTWQEVVVL